MSSFAQSITGAIGSFFGVAPEKKPQQHAAPGDGAQQAGPGPGQSQGQAGPGGAEADKKRGALSSVLSGGTMSSLFGHFAEMATASVGFGDLRVSEAKAAEREGRESKREELRKKGVDEAKVHAQMLDAEYLKDAPQLDPNMPVGKLDTKDQRLAFMTQLTQNDPINPRSEHYCGPTTIIAAALYAKGGKGLEPLLAQMKSTFNDKKDKEIRGQLADIEKKLKSGQGNDLTMFDIQAMQEGLYKHLHRAQEADKDLSPENREGMGIDGKILQNFMRSSPAIKEMFTANKMAIDFTDSDGDGTKNHFVLGINDGGGAVDARSPFNKVFDPYARKGGQMVTEEDQVKDYAGANHMMLTVE